jgi:hypothetical protein
MVLLTTTSTFLEQGVFLSYEWGCSLISISLYTVMNSLFVKKFTEFRLL